MGRYRYSRSGIFEVRDSQYWRCGSTVQRNGDHGVAMAFSVAGHIAKNPIFIDNCELVKTSFPNFVELARQVGMNICLQSQ